ncbi:DUF3426 domain-containing protein [Burkholderia sp. Bp9125]|nr:DUF3426 domain-containing protein [Burkholderia sp. Bp9125]
MLLATRCPHCNTVFRLQQEQLVLHGGLVRCGHCRHVFDAADSLVREHAAQPESALAEESGAASGSSVGKGVVDAPTVASAVAETTVAQAPAAETHGDEAPAVETRAADTHVPVTSGADVDVVAETPAVEAPIADPHIREAAAADAHVAEAPAVEVPVAGTHASEAAADVHVTNASAIEAPLGGAHGPDTAAADSHATEAPAVEANVAEAPAGHATAADVHAAKGSADEAHDAATPPRLFVDSASGAHPSHADFRPDHWDMWAPWLDGNVDPSLQHSGSNISAEPLVPVTLPDGHSADAQPGAVRLTGTPQSSAAFPATAETQPAAPTQGADDLAPPASTALPPAHDMHEPRLATDAPFESPRDVHERAPFAAARDTHEPRFVAAPQPAPDDTADTGTRTAREPGFAAGAPNEPFSALPAEDDRPPFAVTREARAPQRRGLLGGFFGGLVAAVLGVLLVGQLSWWQRETVMIYWPITQSWFQRICAPLGCTVAPPRAIDGLRLEATDLHQLDGPHVLELKAPLTNRYRVALAYPSLELTLLDDTNHVTVRRVLAPRDYVRPGTRIDAGLPAGATQTMVVRVETNGTPASNFRVQIFYP